MASDTTAVLEALVARAAVLNGTKWQGQWNGATTYASRDLVTHAGKTWMSLVDGNRNTNPSSSPLRWNETTLYITQVSGGGAEGVVTPTPNAVPQSTPDGVLEIGWIPPSLLTTDLYVSPDGDDSNDGTAQNAPMRTLYAATVSALALGGAIINFTDNTTVGGPVANQGLWLRNDGVAVPGFLNLNNVRLRYVGHGTTSSNFVFQRPGSANIIGGYDHTKPCIWVVGGEVPVDFEFCALQQANLQGYPAPVRLGWDYSRRPDFEFEAITVTSATRASRATTLTVDLTTATPWAITAADRTGSVVELALTRPTTVAMAPWAIGSTIRVDTGGDADFPNGDFVVSGQSDVLNLAPGATSIWVRYVQAGATTSKSLSGTIVSHGCLTGDRIMLQSSNAEFPDCSMMKVESATVDTITVVDPYGYAPRSAAVTEANIGTVVKHIRGREVSSGVWFNNCSFFGRAETNDDFSSGPTVDIGGTSASIIRFDKTYITGGLVWNWQLAADYDPDRTMVAILGDPGAGTLSGASFDANFCQSQAGAVRWYPHDTEAAIYVDYWLQDSAGNAFPTVVCADGNAYASVRLDRIGQADATVPAVQIGNGYDRLKIKVGQIYSANPNSVVSDSPLVGPDNVRSATWTDQANVPSPWAVGQQTIWSGGLSTEHKGINWAMGALSARYANLFPALASWDVVGGPTAGITITQDGLAPDGSSSAFKIVNANGAPTTFKIGAYPFSAPWANGTGLVFGAWVKFPTFGGSLVVSDYSGGTLFDGSAAVRAERYIASEGWQPVMGASRLETSGGFAGLFYIACTVPAGTSYIWLPTLLKVPAADMGDDEFYEWGSNAKHQPLYLPAGMMGTPEGQKLCAHGGLSTNASNAKTVGGASGQLTLTGVGTVYLPEYDTDGTTIIGWKAMLQATVNP